jgi:GT2 family glycosyltransferase
MHQPEPRPSGSGVAAPGISVVIPSRNGKDLLAAQLPGILDDLPGTGAEVIVVDNGSDDGTAQWLRAQWPGIAVEVSPEPLGFARAVNRGIARARYARVCLLNNDMRLEPGFFAALDSAFAQVPDLFSATAQIRFPPGVRREETGKAVLRQESPLDFPIRCDEPLPGEDLTWVLYGSGGCSLYDAEKLGALGGVDEVYDPAYVEDLDVGYRAWLRGWPSVYVAGAVVEHRHRATTSRYYTDEELAELLDVNYLKFLARAVQSRKIFRGLWRQAIQRLWAGRAGRAPAALRAAAGIALRGGHKRTASSKPLSRVRGSESGSEPRTSESGWHGYFLTSPKAAPPDAEEKLLALTDGSVACFPGHGTGGPLVVAVDRLAPPSAELLARYRQVVVVRGSAQSLAFRAAVELAERKL